MKWEEEVDRNQRIFELKDKGKQSYDALARKFGLSHGRIVQIVHVQRKKQAAKESDPQR